MGVISRCSAEMCEKCVRYEPVMRKGRPRREVVKDVNGQLLLEGGAV